MLVSDDMEALILFLQLKWEWDDDEFTLEECFYFA